MFLDFYHLRQQPFGVTPDPAFLYLSRTHEQALTSLSSGIKEGRGFFALIAEPGMGKTTLLYQLLDGLRDSARTAFLFQTQCDAREFFHYLLSELRVDAQGMGLVAMHNKLNEILFAEMLAGKRFVLVVDEAQNLEDSVLETIRLLSNYETSHTKLLQIVLAGQPQLAAKLAQPGLAQLLQRLTEVARLEPLSPIETACYIEHRLKVAGHSGEPIFLPDAVELIAQKSHGAPRNINKICFRALSEGHRQGRQKITANIVERVAAKWDVQTVSQTTSAVTSRARVFAQPKPQLTYKPLAEFRLRRGFVSAFVVASVLVLGGLGTLLLPRGPAVEAKLEKFFRHSGIQEKRGAAPQPFRAIVNAGDIDRGRDPLGAKTAIEPPASNPENPAVTDVQTFNEENHTRVVVTLDGAVTYDSGRISSPDRIYFDLYKATLSLPLDERTLHVDNRLLTSLRAVQNGEGVRLVLQLAAVREYLAHMEWKPYRLVIDLYGKPTTSASTAAMGPASPSTNTGSQDTNVTTQLPAEATPNKRSLTRELGLKASRIVIDPGHGGRQDTGAVGPHGLLEKDLCLDVALRLGRLIEQNLPGAEVIFTRKNDTYTSLETRTAIANRSNADLFISIHANSSPKPVVRGVETYYLNFATSPESMGVATRENASSQSSVRDLRVLINRIARNEKIEESKELATDIQAALSYELLLVSPEEMNRGVKKAPFIVLIGAEMPSVLSEISFISNANDERLLQNGEHREQLAEGLYAGVAAYLHGLNTTSDNTLERNADIHLATPFGSGTSRPASEEKPR